MPEGWPPGSAQGRPSRSAVIAALRSCGCVFAEQEADLLLEAAPTMAELAALLDRRVAGSPLEHVLGWAEFCGLRIAVDEGVFVPRRRTELLVRLVCELAPADGTAVDLCCGSGAVGAAVRAGRPDLEVHAADLDPAAIRCAARNLPPSHVHQGDLVAALPRGLRGRLDVLVANAPYVPTASIALMPTEARDHEPRISLDGGADGLDLHRRLASSAGDWLSSGGHLVIETSRRQAGRTAQAMALHGLQPRVVTDEEHDGTAVVGTATRRDDRG